MRKKFTKLLSFTALCLFCTINAKAASDEKGNFIYYVGTGGFNNLDPEYAEYYEDWKLYETEPGSNVYSKLFTCFSDYQEIGFRFYTEINDYRVYESDFYRRNLIAAVDPDDPDSYNLKRSEKSIVYTGNAKEHKFCTAKVINNFVAQLKEGYNHYIVVDMNLGKVAVIPQNYRMLVFIDQPEPTLSNISDYMSNDELYYFEPGNYEFNMYDWDTKKWVVSTPDQEVLYDGAACRPGYGTVLSDNRDTHFYIKNWQGGLISPRLPVPLFRYTLDENAAQEDVIYVNVPGNHIVPWAGCSEEVAKNTLRLTKNGDKYTGAFNYYDLANGFNLIVEPGAKGQPAAKVLCPPTDANIQLTEAEEISYAPVAVKTGGKTAFWEPAGYWASYWYTNYDSIDPINLLSGEPVDIEVTPGDKPTVKLTYHRCQHNQKSGMYLRGGFNNWNATSDWEFITTYYPGIYILKDVTIPAHSEFKVGDENWAFIVLGGNQGYITDISINTEYNLVSDDTGNLRYYNNWGDDFQGDVLLIRQRNGWKLILATPSKEMKNPKENNETYTIWRNDFNDGFGYDKKRDLYYSYFTLNNGEYEKAINLHAKKLPYDFHDELWAGSWAINAPYDNYVLEFDEYGIAKSPFTVTEGLTTEKPKQFILHREKGEQMDIYDNFQFQLYIDKEEQMLYAYKPWIYAIFGSFTNYEIPDIKNPEKFDDYYIPYITGGLVEFPKGDVDYTHLYYGMDIFSMKQTEVDFTVTVGHSGYVKYNYAPSRAIVKDWKGGKALIAGLNPQPGCGSYFIDASIIDEFNFIGWEGSLTRENADSDIYTGEVTVDPAKYPDGGCWLNLQLSAEDGLLFGQRSFRNLPDFDENGEMTMEMAIGWITGGVYLDRVTSPCKFKATFDLKKLELKLKLIEGQLAESVSNFEFVANGSDLNGKFVAPKENDSDCVFFSGTVSNNTDNDIAFNMVNSNGQIVAPATDTEIKFDSYGYWEGKSVDISKSPARMRAAARKAAEASAKWHFTLPADCEGTELVMEYDMASNTIRLHSSVHNEGFFVVRKSDDYNDGISDLDALKENRLEMTSDGIFEGEIKLNPAGEGYFSEVKFSRGVDLNRTTTNIVHLGAAAEGSNNPTLSDENPVADYWAWDQDCTVNGLLADAQWWKVTSTKQNVLVKFDAAKLAMQFAIDTAGVEDVIADSNNRNAIVITTGNGTITFTVAADVTLPVYSISGATVKVLNLSAGATTIDIAPGYYIAAGHKIMVR